MVNLKAFLKQQRKSLNKGTLPEMTESSELIYEMIFNRIPEPVFVLDKAGNILVSNASYHVLCGYSKAKNIHHLVNKLNAIQDKTSPLEYFQLAMEGTQQAFECEFITKTGEVIDTLVKLEPVKLNDEFIFLIGAMENKTELILQKEYAENLEIRLNTTQHLADIGTWEYDVLKDQCDLSHKTYEIMGIPYDVSPTFQMILDTCHPEDRDEFYKEFLDSVENQRSFSSNNRILRKDGTERMVMNFGEVILDENNQPVKFIGTTYDITYQKLIENKLATTEDQLLRISESLDVGIWSKDLKDNQKIFVSKGIEAICGYSSYEFQEELIRWEDLVYFEDKHQYEDRQTKLDLEIVPKEQYRIVHRNGNIRWVQDEIKATFDLTGRLIRLEGIIWDITEQKEIEEKINHIAYHDHLTDLPNRRYFEKEIKQLSERHTESNLEYAVMYVDMDGFKRVNDTLGHAIGDKLLTEISSRLLRCIPHEVFAARIGGDEFAVLIREMKSFDQPVAIAKEIVASLEEPYRIDGYELFVTASVGVAAYPHDGDDVYNLLQKADKALYRAKEMGKNTYQIYNSSMNIEAFKLYSLENDLRKAIKNEELLFHYQPKVDAKSGKMLGAEALIRWEHPEWGQVSPAEFIPLSEENDLIFKLTKWTFYTICRQIKEWERLNLPLVPISINISPKLFLKSGWQTELIEILKETKTDPRLVELEITEQALIKNEESFSLGIEELKQMGIKISLDDFGTGYSSLLYLKKFKLDTVKIDKSFVDDILNGKPTITKAIINMAHELNMIVIAEGVETKEQQTFLKEQQCDQIQGYLYSKPLTAEGLAVLFRQPVIKIKQAAKSQPAIERRNFFRVDLPLPFGGNMTIVKIKEKSIKLGKTEVLIDNIGPGGLCFYTHIDLPLNPDITLEFETEILGETKPFYGHIVWKEEQKDGFLQYGVQFDSSIMEQSRITMLLSKLQMVLRQTSNPPKSRVITEDKINYLKRQVHKQ